MASNNALNQTSPNFNVNQITIVNAPVVGTDGTNKTYVDMIAAGFNFKNSTVAGTTAPLTVVYANGAAGVGATLTNAGVQAAFSVDGVTPAINSRILVKNQASSFQNGIYTLTTVGSGASNWVLTRATDYDTVAEINPGDIVPIEQGTVNATTLWLQTATVTTIGVDAITFSQFFGGGINKINGDVGAATAASGAITLTGGTTGAVFTGSGSTMTMSFAGITANGGTVNLGTDNAANAITIGAGNVARNIDIGFSAASHSVRLGVAFGAAAVDIESGSGGVIVNSVGGNVAISGSTGTTVNSAGTINIGNNADAQPINIGTSATLRTVTMGSTTAGSTTTIQAPSAGVFALGVQGVAVSNKNYVTINTSTGALGSDAGPASSITITGNSGGGLTGNSFTFTGGTTGLTFSGAGTTETLTGTLAIANGGTNATSFATTDGTVYYDGTRLVTTATGTSGQILTSNGAGVAPTYQTAGSLTTAFNSITVQVFTGNGTYTPTSGMKYCTIEVVGGGGGGGGTASTGGTTISVAPGGGGGGYARKTVTAATIGGSQTVTIGAAGTAGAVGAGNGGTGGTSSVGAIVSASGGVGGAGIGAAGLLATQGGAGGAGSSGDFNTNGNPGGNSFGVIVATFANIAAGCGGSSFFGGGAPAGTNTTAAGNAGISYGGGGSGGQVLESGTQQAGGAGFAGIVVITEFVH